MFLKRIFAPVGNSLFNRRARAQHAPAEECIILKRLRELMEVTPQVSPTLPSVEGAKVQLRPETRELGRGYEPVFDFYPN